MKHKVLALVLCLAMVLTMTLPGTLAVSVDAEDTTSTFETPRETGEVPGEQEEGGILPLSQDGEEEQKEIPAENPEENPQEADPEGNSEENPDEKSEEKEDATPVTPDPAENDTEKTPEQPSDEEQHQCTCGTGDDTHAEDCPLYNNDDEENTEEEEEEPEGTPPESWGSASLTGAVSFTNVAPLMQLDYGLATLELNDEDYGIAPVAENDNGVVLNKTAKANDNGSFDITLEAYATGEQTTVSHYDPADIVLVLDTSGSMYAGMQDSDFEAVYDTSSNSFSVTASSDYYTKYRKYWIINDDGEYVNACYYANQKWATQDAWNLNSTFSPKTRQNDQQSVHKQFYVVKSGQSRMDSLKTSVNSFISNVFTTSADSSIAIVPFGTNVGTVTGFTSNQAVLSNAVAALTPDGATDSGAAMAKAVELLNSDTVKDNGRKKVVVMFTDGSPCSTGNTFDNSIANAAISNSNTLKANGVTVYTVGVFAGANGAITSVGSSNENTYMHYVSSNYPEATSMTASGDQNNELNGKSYYLSATSSSQLLNIFELISQQVGGATNTTLGTSTVVKDIIAPSFTVPANTSDIKIYTANCTGAGLTFGNPIPATGVTATITGDTLDVTGFDFSNNWCGSHSGTYSGKKLIIEFTVSPKKGFLGGNNVPTNGSTSGLYSNGTPVGLFEVPTVNVPIEDITITASDKNVYLTQVPTEEQLKTGVTIKCGNVDITDPSKLADWQKAYVDIESILTKSDGFNATVDGTYTVTATVNPKVSGDSSKPGTVATAKTGTETKKINVFTPELTYKDSDVYYGDNAPASYDSNLTKTEWKHGETKSTDSGIAMIGTEPTLTLDYIPDATKISDGKINSKQDIPVDVTVKINGTDVTNKTDFEHTDCTGKTCGTPDNGKLWLHVTTCSLTITKAKGENTTIGTDEYFVFNVMKGNQLYTQVTIQGTGSVEIKELPVGTYTVEEDASNAWRYTSSMSGNGSVTLSKDKTSDTVTCTNTIQNEKWLNHFNRVTNIFGQANPNPDYQN